MSVSSCQNQVSRLQKDIGDLRSKIADESKRGARFGVEVASLLQKANSASNLSSVASYLKQAESKRSEAARSEKKVGDWEKQLGNKTGDLGRAQESLGRAQADEARKQERENKQRDDASRKQSEESLKRSRLHTKELEKQAALQRHARRQAMLDIQNLPPKITVLFCGTDTKDGKRLQLDEEIRLITSQIRASKLRDSVELKSVWALRTPELFQAMNEHKPHIVHFSGHGSEADQIVLLDDQGNPKFIEKAVLVQMLVTTASNLHLVVFNTCFSHNQAQAITQHVEAAIGMSTEIGDVAARNFSAQFYSAIGFGRSVQEAYDQAKAYLLSENSEEAQTPVLFVKDGVDANELILVKPASMNPSKSRTRRAA